MLLTILQAAPAQGSPAKKLSPGELLWAALPLIGILLVGALVIYLVERWRRRRALTEQNSDASSEQLSQFRSLYERGEMSREEYESVRTLLAGQLRKEMNVPAPPAAPAITESPDTNIQARPPGPQSPPPEVPPPAGG